MMKQTDILFLNPKQLLSLFIRQLPLVVALAKESSHAEMFCIRLKEYIQKHPNHNSKPAESILTLIRHNNTTIHELSTEKDEMFQSFDVEYRHLIKRIYIYYKRKINFRKNLKNS